MGHPRAEKWPRRWPHSSCFEAYQPAEAIELHAGGPLNPGVQSLRVVGRRHVSPAITLLVRRRISSLPVVAGEELVGVLTTTDLMMALQCALHALQKVSTEIAAAHAQREQAQRGGSLREQLAAEEAVGV